MSSQSILLVDPRPGRRGRIINSLKDHYAVVPCGTPTQARRRVIERKPDLVLLSLRQIAGNGFQLARQLRLDGAMDGRLVIVYGRPTGRPVDDKARRQIERVWRVDRLVLGAEAGAELHDAIAELMVRRPRRRDRNERPPTPPPAVAAAPVRVVSARRSGAERRAWRDLFTADVSVGNLRRLLNGKPA